MSNLEPFPSLPRVPARRPVGRPRREVGVEHICELRRQGRSFREIARMTGFGYGTVRRAYWAHTVGQTAAAD